MSIANLHISFIHIYRISGIICERKVLRITFFTIVCEKIFAIQAISYIKTHSSVSAAKKTKEDERHTSVLFTGTIKLPNSAFHISKTTKPISTKFIYFLPYIYTCHISKLLQHFLRYLFLKIAWFSSHFSSSHKITNIFKLCKNNLPMMFWFLSNLEHQ